MTNKTKRFSSLEKHLVVTSSTDSLRQYLRRIILESNGNDQLYSNALITEYVGIH